MTRSTGPDPLDRSAGGILGVREPTEGLIETRDAEINAVVARDFIPPPRFAG